MAVEKKFFSKIIDLRFASSAIIFSVCERFNFFVTIESALIGGRFLIASNIPRRELVIASII